jgi:vancomycin permeability regulator SanA
MGVRVTDGMSSRVVRFLRERRGQRLAFQATVIATVLGLAPVTWMYAITGSRMRGVSDAPSAPVALVLGAGINGDQPSRLLARRLDVSLALYRAGKVKVLLVSGEKGQNGYNEPEVMRRYLVARGVPDEQVVSDYAGFSTWDSCVRARKVFGVDKAIVVSQKFHLPRALALCEAAGITAYGVGDDSLHGELIGVTLFGNVREVFAAYKAAGEAFFQPDPRTLGPRDPAVAKGLAAAG